MAPRRSGSSAASTDDVQDVDGEARAAGRLRLAPTDSRTALGHRLVIIGDDDVGGHRHRRHHRPGPRIVTLDPAAGRTARRLDGALHAGAAGLASGPVTAEDRQTLVAADAGRRCRADRIRFDDGAPRLRRGRAGSAQRDRTLVAGGPGLDHGAGLGDGGGPR